MFKKLKFKKFGKIRDGCSENTCLKNKRQNYEILPKTKIDFISNSYSYFDNFSFVFSLDLVSFLRMIELKFNL